MMRNLKLRCPRRLGHLWAFFLPVYFFAAAAFDSTEVTNGEYLKFVLATRHSPPEYWSHSRYPKGKENEPVVLVNFHDASGGTAALSASDYQRSMNGRRRVKAANSRSAAISGNGLRRTSISAGKSTKRSAARLTHAIARTAICRSGKMKLKDFAACRMRRR
jgi:hypothetical protein